MSKLKPRSVYYRSEDDKWEELEARARDLGMSRNQLHAVLATAALRVDRATLVGFLYGEEKGRGAA